MPERMLPGEVVSGASTQGQRRDMQGHELS